MFSANEKIEEIPTEHLKYLLLPYFLGDLAMKLTTGERGEIVEMADVYFKDFLQRCDEYGFPDAAIIKSLQRSTGNRDDVPDQIAQLLEMAEDRNTKLRKYREKKELDDEIKRIKLEMERDHDDDTVKRDFYLKLIKSSILSSFDEIKCLATEKQMQDHMKRMRLENPNFENERPKKFPPRPLKPIIITRDAAQKAVYGLGYPSFPIMSVAEFYDKRVADGIFPDPDKDNSLQSTANQLTDDQKDEQENIEREQMEETDDERLRQRNNAMDDWKDEHRRGEGNRHNRS